MSVALLQEVIFGISYKKQVDLVTPLTATDMWSLRQTNSELIQSLPINEDDASDYGKGVYATTVFPSHKQAGGPWNGRLSSEAGAMLACFGMGKRTKTATTATGGFKYTCTQPNFVSDGLDMPSATMAVQIRTGGAAITDKAIIGACLEEWQIQLTKAPGRDSATFTSQWTGTGQDVKPSGIVIPATYAEHSMNAGALTSLSLVGFDYLANKRFSSCNFGLKNNIRPGFFPGSGAQNGYQIEGRKRRGVPQFTLTARVECDSGSSEEDALLAQTEGTGVITLTGAQIASGPETHQFKITFQRLRVKTDKIGDDDGIATYDLEYTVLQHVTNGVVTIESICEQDNILG